MENQYRLGSEGQFGVVQSADGVEIVNVSDVGLNLCSYMMKHEAIPLQPLLFLV